MVTVGDRPGHPGNQVPGPSSAAFRQVCPAASARPGRSSLCRHKTAQGAKNEQGHRVRDTDAGAGPAGTRHGALAPPLQRRGAPRAGLGPGLPTDSPPGFSPRASEGANTAAAACDPAPPTGTLGAKPAPAHVLLLRGTASRRRFSLSF